MKNVGGILAIVVIALCAVWMLYYQKAQPKPGEPVATRMPVACDKCEHTWVQDVSTFPVKCPKCGEMAGYRGQQCGECGRVFPYPDWGKPGSGAGRKCKYCESTRVGEVAADAIPTP